MSPRRFLPLCACAVLGASVLAGCGSSTQATTTAAARNAAPADEPVGQAGGGLPDGVWRCYLHGSSGDDEPTDVWMTIRGWTYSLSERPGGDRRPGAGSPYALGTQEVDPGNVALTFAPGGWNMLGEYAPRARRLFLRQPAGTRARIGGQCNPT